MAVIAFKSPVAKSAAQSRSQSYEQASDAVQRALEGDREAARGFWRMAASLVGHDASSIARSSLLALRQNPLRHGRCPYWLRVPQS
jgi:hypothetical protein